jgi:hypothetical protein
VARKLPQCPSCPPGIKGAARPSRLAVSHGTFGVLNTRAHHAAAVSLSRNNPSGIAEPSHADERITTGLREAVATVDIRVPDHLTGTSETYSASRKGGLL